MAVYAITGGLGAGKSLQAVSKIREALASGRRVATNMNINIEHLVAGTRDKYDLTRMPDYPGLEDFQALGPGSEGKFDEKTFGIIVLDEVATFLNNREWNYDPNDDGPKEGAQKRAVKKRLDLIKWLRHARKHRWHLYLITQGLSSLDPQVRNELIEHEVRCRRMDRMTVPLLSSLTKVLGFGRLALPQVHVGVVYYMELGRPTKVDTWYVPDARLLWKAYDTEQELNGECLGASMLDHRHAPWLWKPKGLREALWEKFTHRWFPPSAARQRYDDFRLAKLGAAPACKPHVSYEAWASARAGHPGPLGAVGGEAAGPALHESMQQAA
jgi:hypothetical protein